MRKFKVLNCKTEVQVGEIKRYRDNDGNMREIMQYRKVKAGEKGFNPSAYGHEGIKVGDVLEIDGHLADKAANNPDFEEVLDIVVPQEEAPAQNKAKKK